MFFKWSQYIDVADSLAEIAREQKEDQEAFYRAGISRAYYAAFHMTKKTFGFDSGYGSEHKRLLDFLGMEPSPEKKHIKKILNRLKIRRVDADYHEEKRMTENDLHISINEARKILDILS